MFSGLATFLYYVITPNKLCNKTFFCIFLVINTAVTCSKFHDNIITRNVFLTRKKLTDFLNLSMALSLFTPSEDIYKNQVALIQFNF